MNANQPQGNELYHEEMNFFWGWLAVILFFGVTVLFIILYFVQRTSGPIGQNPAPDSLLLILPAFYFIIALAMLNFLKLTITADPRGITVRYGRISRFEPWDNIESAERDTSSALRSYGGYGIRMGWKQGGTAWVYNIMGPPLLLLKLRQGKSQYFGFSTKRPDEILAMIHSWKR